MNRNINFIFLLKSLGLGLIISILFRIDFWRLQINFSLSDGFISLWLMGFLPALVLGYPIIRTSWSGWRLICTVFLIYFGITTFMTQIEAVVFLQHLVDIIPTKDTFSLFFNGAVRAAILAPLIVVTHGKYFRTEEGIEQIVKIAMNIRQWIVKLSLVALIYTIIYILFGALVFKPLAGAAFDEYYAGLQMPPWIIPFQLIRGILFAFLAFPVISMLKGSFRETGWTVSLLFSVLLASLVLPPNEFMPPTIRFPHMIELFTSMFLFGWIVTKLFYQHRSV
ncbi:MAG TPA: hypothetical protein ENO17_05345 [Candidatus Atribacteria bacterium]|nr:hypothetical protein [Candidatus Atribacteria bacterium]